MHAAAAVGMARFAATSIVVLLALISAASTQDSSIDDIANLYSGDYSGDDAATSDNEGGDVVINEPSRAVATWSVDEEHDQNIYTDPEKMAICESGYSSGEG